MYRKGHMGTDHFLGEIVVPLREVEEVDGSLKEADIRRYTLGGRSAKDKVRPLSSCIGTEALRTCGILPFSTMQPICFRLHPCACIQVLSYVAGTGNVDCGGSSLHRWVCRLTLQHI